MHRAVLRRTVSLRASPLWARGTEQWGNNARKYHAGEKIVTLIPGDGVGPELSESAIGVLQASGAPVNFEVYPTVRADVEQSFDLMASIARNQVVLKGAPINWEPPGHSGYMRNRQTSRNPNAFMRSSLNLFANVVPIKSLPGIKTKHQDIDIVVFRENTEAEYSGLEQEIVPGVVQALKVVTRPACDRIAEAAFRFAAENNRKVVSAIHKANIHKMSDGLFLESCREVSKKYPQIQYRELIIDNTCMQLVMKPQQFDVMVTPNLYGNLVINTGAALIGGVGVLPGDNWGLRGEHIFEPGARHAAKDIQGGNTANPTGMLLATVMMLRHLRLPDHAQRIEKAVVAVLSRGKVLTKDLGGFATTTQFTKAVINELGRDATERF